MALETVHEEMKSEIAIQKHLDFLKEQLQLAKELGHDQAEKDRLFSLIAYTLWILE